MRDEIDQLREDIRILQGELTSLNDEYEYYVKLSAERYTEIRKLNDKITELKAVNRSIQTAFGMIRGDQK